MFDGGNLSDALNPVNNVYNSTINTLGSSTSYGVDLDSYDVSASIAARDTLATTTVSVGPDLVILNAVLLQVKSNIITGTVFEDVNYGGGSGRNLATAVAAAPGFTVPRPNATLELYDAAGNLLRTTTTDASGGYGFAGLVDGDYTVRVANGTVRSSRPGATGSEWPVQTFRTNASSGIPSDVTDEVGGASPSSIDAAANVTNQNLGSFVAQSKAPVRIITGIAAIGVDFGFNFDTIVNRNDGGQGSLRQLLANANALGNASLAQQARPAGIENAVFMLADGTARPGMKASYPSQFVAGVATISPASSLPAISDPLALDATTQPGWSSTPIVEINGAGAGASDGLTVSAGGSTIRGLAIGGFPAVGKSGILITGAGGNTIAGNHVGTDAAGTAAAPNYWGITTDNSTNNIIGGTTAADRNIVSGNSWRGVNLASGATGNLVRGNYIGTNAAGTAPLSNLIGVYIREAPGNTIGGTTPQTANLVSGNASIGVYLFGAAATGNLVQGNVIGLDATRTAGLGNGEGVLLHAAQNTIGGAAPGAGNIIASNIVRGIGVSGAGRERDAILANSIYANAGLGIDLGNDGFTANDGAITAGQPNRFMDFPVFTSAVLAGGNLSVSGYVGSAPGQPAFAGARVEIFQSDGDPSGYGEGRTYLGFLTAAANGGFQGSVPAAGLVLSDTISGTATDTDGNTSEFGPNGPLRPLAIVKKAFLLDGTPLAAGSTVPKGGFLRFLLYINNQGPAVQDVSLADALDPAFAYVGGSILTTSSPPACALFACAAAEEAGIVSAAISGTPGTDALADDTVSYGATTVYAGDQSAGNTQLDIAGGKIWALVFTVRMR